MTELEIHQHDLGRAALGEPARVREAARRVDRKALALDQRGERRQRMRVVVDHQRVRERVRQSARRRLASFLIAVPHHASPETLRALRPSAGGAAAGSWSSMVRELVVGPSAAVCAMRRW